MLILNINGPMNSGKSTVSKILVNRLSNAVFIEVDDLMSDSEQEALGLSLREGWKERHKRLNAKLSALKQSQEYEIVIFAYPIADNTYQDWKAMEDEKTRFINITLAPSLEMCLKNRGTRELTDWEKKRIREMYLEGYQNRPYSDFIINNDHQTPDETAEVIKGFLDHALSPKQQWLHLVERRWPALLNGEKTSTFRLNEGFVHKGFLVYKDCPKEQCAEVVYVTRVYYMPFKQACEIDGYDEHTPDMKTALKQMKMYYPNITLDTPVLLAQHLSVPETKQKYLKEVKKILDGISKQPCDTKDYLGKIVSVLMDRPLGSKHPKHGFTYPVNYGYVPGTLSGDGEELDAYVLGVQTPLNRFEGKCIAVIHRTNDNDDKLIVVPKGVTFSDEDIERAIHFQEQWFQHVIIREK